VTTIKPYHVIHGIAPPLRLTLSRGLWQQQTGICVKVHLLNEWKGFFKLSGVKWSKLNATPDIFV
jgi:hypothetical protein